MMKLKCMVSIGVLRTNSMGCLQMILRRCGLQHCSLYALGTFMGASGSADSNKQGGGGTGTMYQLEEKVHFRMEIAVSTGVTIAIKDDASPMCRKELLTVISCLSRK